LGNAEAANNFGICWNAVLVLKQTSILRRTLTGSPQTPAMPMAQKTSDSVWPTVAASIKTSDWRRSITAIPRLSKITGGARSIIGRLGGKAIALEVEF
jgi:hypothetical protein